MSQNDAQEIIQIAQETRAHLSGLELDLSSEIEAIEQAAFAAGRDMTAAETLKHDQFRAALAETRDAFAALGFVTMQALNKSETARRLSLDIQDANNQIKGDLERLKKIVSFTQTAAQILDGLANIAAKVATLVV